MKIIKNRLKIRSKNHSAKLLDRLECDKLSVLRLGSKTPNEVVFANITSLGVLLPSLNTDNLSHSKRSNSFAL